MTVLLRSRLSAPARDVLVAGGCWLAVMIVLLTLPLLTAGASVPVPSTLGSPSWWACAATFTAQAVALVWARRLPRATVITVAALPLPLATLATGDVFSLSSALVMAVVFLAGLTLPLRDLIPVLVAAVLLVAAGELINASGSGLPVLPGILPGLLQGLGAAGAPLLLATAIGGRRDARQAHEQEVSAMAREQLALVRAAIADERTAMARELHDIAAHHMSGIALMAAAIDRQIDTDPAAAKRSVRQVRTQSTAVLEDLRRLVGLLREDADATRSVESLEAITELVELRRAAGADVELVLQRPEHGGPLGAGIGPLAQLALYRILQESLTNAARHAHGAPVVVTLDDRQNDALLLTVVNGAGAPATDTPPGFGLVGMRERADLLGALLDYGPTPEGGWRVQVELRRDPEHWIDGERPEATT